MARICIDVRCLMEGRRTGVEEYTLGLLLALFEHDRSNEYLLFSNCWKEPRFDFGIFEKYVNVKLVKTGIPNKLLNLSFWYFGWPKIDRMVGGADVVFFPNIIFGSVSRGVKVVTTIHDLSFERYPEYFSLKRRFWHIFINPKKLCQKSDALIAVSDSTGDDLAEKYQINKKKISSILSGAADEIRPADRNDTRLLEVKEKYGLPFKFILYLGTLEPRKNIVGIIKAYNQLQAAAEQNNDSTILGYKLVVAGASGWLGDRFLHEWNKSKYKDKIILPGFINDEDKTYVYSMASLFVYPSFFEGFGFPPLEAMKCGVPIIASNNSSLPEICQDVAILVDPDKSEEICQAMREILTQRELREKCIAAGLKRAALFSWKKSAKEVLKLLII